MCSQKIHTNAMLDEIHSSIDSLRIQINCANSIATRARLQSELASQLSVFERIKAGQFDTSRQQSGTR